MEPLQIICYRCTVDWRENEEGTVRIIEIELDPDSHVFPRHYEFLKGGYLELDENKWVVEPSKLTQGTTVALQNHPMWRYGQRELIYPESSQIDPLTPEFQRELYEELHGIATPEKLKELFLEHYQPVTDIDVKAVLKAEHCFIWKDNIRACGEVLLNGQFKKKIGDYEYILHCMAGRYSDHVGLFIEGNLGELELKMSLIGYPAGIMLEFAESIPQLLREETWYEVQSFMQAHVSGVSHYKIDEGKMIPQGPINGIDILYPHDNKDKQEELEHKLERIRSKFRMEPNAEGIYILS